MEVDETSICGRRVSDSRRFPNEYFVSVGSDQLPLLDVELVETLPFAERSVFVSVVFREEVPSGRVTTTLTFSSVVELPSSNFVVVVSFSLTVFVPSRASTVSRITE